MITFSRSAADLIRTRRSWRSFREETVAPEDKERIRSFVAGMDRCPFGSRVRLVLAEAPRQGFGKVRGTYGVVSGASSFLIGAVKPSQRCFLDYGYLFEATILYITSLGLGTCWLGGTFDRTFFSDMARLEENEIIPTISPVGIIAPRRHFIDSLFVMGAGSRKRGPWDSVFFRNSFDTPLGSDAAGPFALPLEMVRLAPSASNKQPWRVVMNETGFHFHLARAFGYSLLFKDVDLQAIDMGIAMFHFEQTAHELGLPGSWRVLSGGTTSLPTRTEYVVSWVI